MPRSIGEWDAVSLFDLSYFRFKVLAILVIISFFVDRKKNRYWEVFIIIVALIYAFRHQRHTPIFAIVAAPFLTEKLSLLGEKVQLTGRINSVSALATLNLALSLLIGYQLYHASSRYFSTEFNIIVDPKKFPVYAVNFLKENGVKGNILLPFEWGEYIIWKLYPDCRVSIDGRFRTVYPEEVLVDHFQALSDKERWNTLINKYQTNIILTRRHLFSRQMMSERKDWIYIYSDNIAMIFIKDEDSQRTMINRFRRKELIYPSEKLSIFFP
jgi:hypothetical protein